MYGTAVASHTRYMLRLGSRAAASLSRGHTALAARPALGRARPWASAAATTAEMARTGPKAASIVIGNEVLNGSIQDTNTVWLAKMLYSRGVDLARVEMIPDIKEDIVSTIKRLKEVVGEDGFIFTSGGIGPTHDDITYESIAAAFGECELELHAPTVAKMEAHYGAQGKELNAARLRMATIPRGAEVLDTPEIWVPLVNMRGVYILPGIPRLFQGMLGAHKERFTGPQFHMEVVYTKQGEGEIADVLTAVAKDFPEVNIGSYPNVGADQGAFTTKLSFESRDTAKLEGAVAAVEAGVQTFRM